MNTRSQGNDVNSVTAQKDIMAAKDAAMHTSGTIEG